ncbi:GNAT family N-acetyltransferase [Flavobacterium jejuense]|uniref:GNAT family N-acetyltransferase n=1 Tax=Flavobacterium jejuense TaxID=1544455 RepID=A0ABX0IU60_9FLAO|nr:GNAT family N-acetyltransferase [Flavobacterium jejuense]NHN27440.1 GNAT family N-acetyltransferase [Flavobacterium jejuense]
MAYTFQPLTKNNLQDVQKLYKLVFENEYSIAYITKKYDTSYLIDGYFGHIAYFNEEPVAFHGAIPILMQYNGVYEIAAQYGDAMTLSNHNGKGLFTKLGKLTDAVLKKKDIKFVWGFPNQNSEYGYLNKLDWKFKERIVGFKSKNPIISLEKISKINSKTKLLYKKHIEKVFYKYKCANSLTGSVYKNNTIVSTTRSKEFYKYKSLNQNFVIEIEKVKFWIKIKNGLLIGDIETPSPNQFYIALNILKKIAFKNGLHEITIQASPNTLIEELMNKTNWNRFDSWIVGYKNFSSSFPLENLKLTFGDLDTF